MVRIRFPPAESPCLTQTRPAGQVAGFGVARDAASRDPARPGLKTVRKQGADISRARSTEQQRLPPRDRSRAA
jgi:hypothetical protein